MSTMMPAEIRGLTLWRPWDQAFYTPAGVGPGPKLVENRDTWWPYRFTGQMQDGTAEALPDRPLWIALHAGQKLDKQALAWIRQLGLPGFVPGPSGVITGVVRLVRVIDVDWIGREGREDPNLRRLAPYAFGRYSWEVGDTIRLPEPVPCTKAQGVRCFQGLWTLPPPVLEQVRDQAGAARLLHAPGSEVPCDLI